VLLGTRDAEVIALNESDGAELWRSRLSSEVLSVPQVQGETVVVHTIDGKLYGLDVESGAQQWEYDRTVPVLTLRGNSSPVIDGSSVIAGFASGKLVNLDLYSGDPRWETLVTPPRGRSELERIIDIDADPVIYDGIIYVCTFQGEVAALSMDTGVVLWRRPVSSHAGLSADWRHVYVSDAKDQVWALDPHTGAGLWKQDKLLNRRLTAPAILDDYVLVGDLEGYVHWLSYEDGSLMARTRVGNAPISAPLRVVDDIAYVYTEDGVVTAMTAGDLIEDDYLSDDSEESTDTRYYEGEAGNDESSGLEDTLGPFDPLKPSESY
jgi:outer membrane protein assembly factor BamB